MSTLSAYLLVFALLSGSILLVAAGVYVALDMLVQTWRDRDWGWFGVALLVMLPLTLGSALLLLGSLLPSALRCLTAL